MWKRCSAYLPIMEMLARDTLRFKFSPIRKSVIRAQKNNSAGEDVCIGKETLIHCHWSAN